MTGKQPLQNLAAALRAKGHNISDEQLPRIKDMRLSDLYRLVNRYGLDLNDVLIRKNRDNDQGGSSIPEGITIDPEKSENIRKTIEELRETQRINTAIKLLLSNLVRELKQFPEFEEVLKDLE